VDRESSIADRTTNHERRTTKRVLKLTLAYDGTHYAGWQRQRGQPTIQAALEQVLRRVCNERVRVVGSGRTDRGVHALGQVAHVHTRSRLPLTRLQRALNSLLPPDIVVTSINTVSATFHARFSAKRKRYRYRMAIGPWVSPFVRRYVYWMRQPLQLVTMQHAARALLGTHDFAPFQAMGRPTRETVRRITQASITRHGEELWVEIEATGFLYKMVRRIVGTLIHIGQGQRPPTLIREILKSSNSASVGPTAPAQGLTLVSVSY